MSDIYVTGHRNPDTDSIVAAIAYANLRQALGDRDYKAIRLGHINDETRRMLDRFGFEAPERVKNLRTQVKDLDFDRPPVLRETVTMGLAWNTMKDGDIPSLPITDENGRLYGLLSAGDIATFDLKTIGDCRIESIPVFNLISVLEGRLVNEYNFIKGSITGNVTVALQGSEHFLRELDSESIVICGGGEEAIMAAAAAKAACIIICRSDIRSEWKDIGEDTCVLSTPLSGRAAARLIFQAAPCGRICIRDNIQCFHLDDYLDDVREAMLRSRFRCYPVLDAEDRVVGTLSRYHLLKPRRKKVVLVDHNEAAQSVPALDQVEIMEIIDHHRLADIQTVQPISVRNEPVGSTNTIITEMYQEKGVMPSPAMAGLMASAILSDTVMFKSPTCTKRDIAMAERLCRIAGITTEELGRDLFSASRDMSKSAEELFGADYKQFNISEQTIGVSQITCDSADWYDGRREEFTALMEKMKKDAGLDMVILMITDVLKEGSHLFFVGDDEMIRQAFNTDPENGHIFLPGVMSRKKQIIPMFTALWG